MEKITPFGMKDSLTFPSLAIEYFSSLRDETDERVFTYNDDYMPCFERTRKKVRPCGALNQY